MKELACLPRCLQRPVSSKASGQELFGSPVWGPGAQRPELSRAAFPGVSAGSRASWDACIAVSTSACSATMLSAVYRMLN